MVQKEARVVPGEALPADPYPALAELCTFRRARVLKKAAWCVSAEFGVTPAGERYTTFSGATPVIPEGSVRAEIAFDSLVQLGLFWRIVDREMELANQSEENGLSFCQLPSSS
ncbi:MAG: hypothetical protein ABID04_00575 [Patescibacteria group bacterium]